MGLFSKKEDKNNGSASLPPPPSGQGGAGSNNGSISNIPKPDLASVPNEAILSPPPIPGGNLEDIKQEVASAPSFEENLGEPQLNSSLGDFNNDNIMNEVSNSLENSPTSNSPNASQNKEDLDDSLIDDSLFNLDGLDIKKLNSESHINSETVDKATNSSSLIDTNKEEKGSLDFLEKEVTRKTKNDEPLFITTSQFKSMIEIIDNVKLKVRESSEIHLRLMDMKSEEDIEYENLRKNFQFFEEKLYDLDSILFDK